MAKGQRNFTINNFYCTKCGQRGISIPRRRGREREAMHLKSLWCPFCKGDYNHVECRNDQEIKIFKEKYEAGEYNDKVIYYDGASRMWQNYLDKTKSPKC